jgi:hypothetical protein
MKGTVLAATFSWGCKKANQLGITPFLKEYALSGGKSHSEEEIREALKKLLPYFYYQVIAKSNGIEDSFDLKVVQAHWIGNELTEKVKISVIKEALQGMEGDHEKMVLAIIVGLLKKTGSAHHNVYGQYTPNCSVTSDGKYLYHLRERRVKATPEDLKNLERYGNYGKR